MFCIWIMDVKFINIDVRIWGGEEDSELDVEFFFECGSGGLIKKKS